MGQSSSEHTDSDIAPRSKISASAVDIFLNPLAETDRLSLAKQVLTGVAVLLLLGGIGYVLVPDGDKAQKIFDASLTILPQSQRWLSVTTSRRENRDEH